MGAVAAATRAAEETFGTPPASARALHGGDLSDVLLLEWPDGRRVVAKCGPLVDREARMLRAIRSAGAPAPDVLACTAHVLFLETLDEASPTPPAWQSLGVGLRRLHDSTGATYGWQDDYAFGSVEILNDAMEDWPAFWGERRLLATANGTPADLRRRIDALVRRLPDLLPSAPPPALLHGDLWSGNALFGPGGTAFFIDPACYHGHAEVDLAMLHLFGRPAPAFWEGYGPTEPGMDDRRPVYQLWPALVHLRLFGSSYRGLVERCLSAVGG
ncbi:fructosamine kinase family protein [Tropicimonas isoalkanivorans]|uniref:Fructosamine-3-kinase n=1 Tax=Tropicimonas isoalkanivorans TaxID=441112 RepID=A0A1I1G3G7_9RHOB|nr:fructosamine kinase family protein [Tropicimonas isoalkanivorans]SFC03740.1 Fructosamine-3-kinase [Tropicimonas isoalkanivorans]